MILSMNAIVRGRSDFAKSEDDDISLFTNNRGDLLVNQGLPERTEIVRMGRSFVTMCPTAVAPVTAVPTTASIWTIQNLENEGPPAGIQRCYVLDSVAAITTTSSAAAINLGPILIGMQQTKVALMTGNDTLVISNLSGSSNGSKLVGKTASALDVAPSWAAEGQCLVNANVAGLGLTVKADVYGRYILRPSYKCGFHLLCNAAGTAVVKIVLVWHEVDIILG